jgi:mannonate dehydratase
MWEDIVDRRQFFGISGAGALALAAPAATMAQPAARPAGGARTPSKLKLGCQSGPSDEKHFAYFARYGVRNICANAKIADPTRLYATVDELKRMVDLAGKYDLKVDLTDSILLTSSHIDREANPGIMLGLGPQRDREIEAFQNHIKNCAAAGVPGVKYNQSLLGVLRNQSVKGRGDVVYSGWDLATARANPPLTRAGTVSADAAWERISYFLERVVPVAEEYKVRIACHPQDPGTPAQGYQGVYNVLGTIDGMKKFITIKENPYHGFNFCQGTVSENLANPSTEIFDVIRYFGSRKKIFNVHFRNIRGRRDKFVEVFPDEGDINMLQAALTYKEVGYDGMLMPDHVPVVPTGRGNQEYAYNYGGAAATDDGHLESFAFAYGYIRGIIQAVDQLA